MDTLLTTRHVPIDDHVVPSAQVHRWLSTHLAPGMERDFGD
jgi:hypothetical protein